MVMTASFAGTGGGGVATNIPVATVADNNKVISVDAAGDYVLTTPSAAAFDINALTQITVEDGATDFVPILDATDGQPKKILVDDLMSGGTL